MEPDQGSLVDNRAVADDHAGDIYRKEPVAPKGCGETVRDQRHGKGKNSIEPLVFQFHNVDHMSGNSSDTVSQDSPDCHLLHEERDQGKKRWFRLHDERDRPDR